MNYTIGYYYIHDAELDVANHHCNHGHRFSNVVDSITNKSAKPRRIPCLKLLFVLENISLIQQCLEVAMFLIQYVNPAVNGPYIIAENTNKIKTIGKGVASVTQIARCRKYIDCTTWGEILNRIQIKYIETHNSGIRNRK